MKLFWKNVSFQRRSFSYRECRFIGSMAEIPDKLGGCIYVVGNRQRAKWVVFDCPCGRGHRLSVNLMESVIPYWTMELNESQVTLSPSLVVTDYPCSSHFFLIRSKVHWFRPQGWSYIKTSLKSRHFPWQGWER